MEQQAFETADLYLASAVCIINNIMPDFKVKNNKTLFIFPLSDDLYKAMNGYNNGVALNAYGFAQMIKRLRAEMLMRRGNGGQQK